MIRREKLARCVTTRIFRVSWNPRASPGGLEALSRARDKNTTAPDARLFTVVQSKININRENNQPTGCCRSLFVRAILEIWLRIRMDFSNICLRIIRTRVEKRYSMKNYRYFKSFLNDQNEVTPSSWPRFKAWESLLYRPSVWKIFPKRYFYIVQQVEIDIFFFQNYRNLSVSKISFKIYNNFKDPLKLAVRFFSAILSSLEHWNSRNPNILSFNPNVQ